MNPKDKNKLRDELFTKYFEVTEGINVKELVSKIGFIREKYAELKNFVYNGDGKIKANFFDKAPRTSFYMKHYF